MTGGWALLSLVIPTVAATVAGLVGGTRKAPPWLVIGLNAIMPGTGLAAARRPVLEVAAGVVFATISLITVGRVSDLVFWVPIMFVGGAWGLIHTPLSPFTADARRPPAPPSTSPSTTSAKPAPRSSGPFPAPPPAVSSPPDDEFAEEAGYAVVVKCTECGAGIDVPVLQHAAHCPYCGTDHLLVGQDDTLYLTLPEQVQGDDELRDAVLDHYRYMHYLKLYKRHVAPLERQADDVSTEGVLTSRPQVEAAAAAAEIAVTKKADAYRARLAEKLRLGQRVHFLAPYRHGMGTMYQAAFGRSRTDQEKELRFAIATIEAATLATSVMKLPAMGKLSYLKALLPVAQCDDTVRTLPLEASDAALERAYGDLDRKKLVRDIDVIRHGSAFSQEVSAVVWRPWWITEVVGPSIHETLLVDSAGATVAGASPSINPEVLEELPEAARDTGGGLHFLPMQCPTCGFEFPFEINAVMHFCRNCHRVCGVHDDAKHEVEYDRTVADDDEVDLVPFWRFALELRTGDNQLITDLRHLKDGIDGRLDQIGDDADLGQHGFFIPAVRCINSRLMVEAFKRLLMHTLRHPPRLARGRYPLDVKPSPWPVNLEETEARMLAPLCLANVFGRRDLARVNVHQVGSWLFDARLESEGRLTYLAIPRAVTEPFRAYTGRFRGRALQRAASGSGESL